MCSSRIVARSSVFWKNSLIFNEIQNVLEVQSIEQITPEKNLQVEVEVSNLKTVLARYLPSCASKSIC